MAGDLRVGIFLDLAPGLAGAKICYDNDGCAFCRISWIFVSTGCQYKTEPSIRLWNWSPFDCIHVARTKNKFKDWKDLLQPGLGNPDRKLLVYLRVHDWPGRHASRTAGLYIVS